MLAASTFGNIWWRGARLDEVNARIDELATRLDARIDELGTRLDARLGGLDQRLHAHVTEHRSA